jgi:large subunit ribosomal protein L5
MYDTRSAPRSGREVRPQEPDGDAPLEKIVLNVNMGRHLEGTKIPPDKKQTVIDTLTKITGQKPVVVKARKSVSNFKLRAGFETAAMVTMRRERMWHFLDRLINLATPRIKDFRGLPDKAFDRQGNYALGLTEQGVFPEINMAEATFTHGMHINVCLPQQQPRSSPLRAGAARHAVREAGREVRRLQRSRPEEGGAKHDGTKAQYAKSRASPSSAPASCAAASSPAAPAACTASSASAASCSASSRSRARSRACARPAGKNGQNLATTNDRQLDRSDEKRDTMAIGDPIADMLTRIRNAVRNKSKTVDCLNSKVCRGIAEVLRDEGYIDGFDVIEDGRQGQIKHPPPLRPRRRAGPPPLTRRASPAAASTAASRPPQAPAGPGHRDRLHQSKGVLSDRKAREERVGGELLCVVE